MALSITQTNENFSFWKARPYLNNDVRQLLDKAQVLILPEEQFRDYEIPLFPANTTEIYRFLQSKFNIEAVINEEDFREVGLYSKSHRFGKFLVLAVVVPTFVAVLSNYISDKLKNENKDDKVEFEIIIQTDNGNCKSIKYVGKTSDLKSVVESANKILQEDANEHRSDTTITEATKKPRTHN